MLPVVLEIAVSPQRFANPMLCYVRFQARPMLEIALLQLCKAELLEIASLGQLKNSYFQHAAHINAENPCVKPPQAQGQSNPWKHIAKVRQKLAQAKEKRTSRIASPFWKYAPLNRKCLCRQRISMVQRLR